MTELENLAIERACERLVVAYTHLVDFGEAERVAELFASDGLWVAGDIRFEGHDAIQAMFRGRQEMVQRRSRHVCTNLGVEVVDEDHATGLVYLQLYRHDFEDVAPEALAATLAPAAHPVAVGEYHDQFVRTPEGWRFAARRAELAFGSL
jgi:hypothetical protein